MGGDTHVETGERGSREVERTRRHVDQMHCGLIPARDRRFNQNRQLLAAAAAKLDVRGVLACDVHQRWSQAGEQGRLAARDAIPGEAADRLEERRPECIVEPPRRQPLRLREQARTEVLGKGGTRRSLSGRNGTWHRHRDSEDGTSCGRCAAHA